MRGDRALWVREGNWRAWADGAIAQCARDHRGNAVGAPTVVVQSRGEQTVTALEASGSWWREHMRVHGHEWSGPLTADHVADLLRGTQRLG